MKQEKYNISIERDALRLNNEAKSVKLKYPKAYGDKTKNNFITTKNNSDNIFVIKTPTEKNVIDAYSKLKEITNVVYVQSYNDKELIWPFSNYENISLANKVTISIDSDFYKEMTELNKNLPKLMLPALNNVKENFKLYADLINPVFGDCTLKISKNNIEFSNIKLDSSFKIFSISKRSNCTFKGKLR